MSASSRNTIRPTLERQWGQRWIERVSRALEMIDIPSLKLALKSCIAIVLATGLAFWLDISATITAITAFMIQQAYVGSTIYRGALRFMGGSVGAILALPFLALFAQDRVLFIGSMSLCAGVIVYLLQGTRYWYAYILCMASLMVVGYGTIEQPTAAFPFAVTWASGILLAVVVVSVVRTLLWPTLTSEVLEKQLRSNFEDCRQLGREMMEWLASGQGNETEMDRLTQKLIQGMPQPQTTLQTAFFDSWQVDRYQAAYNHFLIQFNALAQTIIAMREDLRICQARSSHWDAEHQPATLHRVVDGINQQMQDLIDALQAPRDGTSRQLQAAYDRSLALDPVFHALCHEIREFTSNGLDQAALLGLVSRLQAFSQSIPQLQATLGHVETSAAESKARLAPQSRQAAPPLQRRVTKAIVASILTMVIPWVWIMTNWPAALHRVFVYAGVLACFNAMFPVMPRRAILNALFWGFVGGAVMQFAVLRPMEDFLGLALAMSMAMLPCCYFANSRNPSTMISGLFGGMIIIGLMDLSLQQSYSFSGFANNVIGYSGGFLIPMLVLQLFVAATPEQTFCKTVSSFFQACEQSLDHLSADPPWTDRGQKVLGASHAVLVKSFKMSGLWSKLLNHRRISKDDLSKIGRLLVHMQALMIRREMMERTRIKLISKSELGDLTTAEQQLRKSLSGFLAEIHAVVQSIDGQPDLEAALARQQEVRQLLEPLQNQVSSRTQSGEQDYPAIVLTSYYRAVTDAIDQCFEDMQTIDWKRLQQSYI